jgi:glycosyltransferase involved in cell wall biosynthesis
VRFGLVIYGSLQTLSGGFFYDRQLVKWLHHNGDSVDIVSMPWKNYASHLLQNTSTRWLSQVKKISPNILIQDELNHPSLFIQNWRIKKETGVPLVAIVHHLRSNEEHPRVLKWIYQLVESRYLKSLDGVIYNSQTTRKSVEALSGKGMDGVVAYPAGNQFENLPDEAAISERASRPGVLRLLFIGNVIPRKGLHVLIQALAALPRQSWMLTAVGRLDVNPAYAQSVQRLAARLGIADRITFCGPVNQQELGWKLSSHQLLTVPSYYEGFGIVYLEGMSFGLPALATTAGAAWEIIEDGRSGVLVPVGNQQAISERLTNLMDDRKVLTEMSLAARQRYNLFPTWAQSMETARQYLHTLAVEKGGG